MASSRASVSASIDALACRYTRGAHAGDLAELSAFPVPGRWETAAVEPFMLAAFPKTLAADVRRASVGLAPAKHPTGDRLIQDSYKRRWGQVIVGDDELKIP